MTCCSKCGAAQPEGAKFCPECGAPLTDGPARASGILPQRESAPQGQQKRRRRKPLLRRWWVWLLIIAAILGAVRYRGRAKPTGNLLRQLETTAPAKPAAAERPTAAPKPAMTAPPTAKPAPTAPPTPQPTAPPTGVSPEFKATMDSYEAFFDEYIAFMKAVSDDPTNTAMLLRYAAMMMKYTETVEKLEAIDESRLSPADDAYYLEVLMRIQVKLLEAVQYTQ